MKTKLIVELIRNSSDYLVHDLSRSNAYEDDEYRIAKVFEEIDFEGTELTAGVLIFIGPNGKVATRSFFNDSTSCDFSESRFINISMYNSSIQPERYSSATKSARSIAEEKMVEIRDFVHELLDEQNFEL